jgi:hypothetical protein
MNASWKVVLAFIGVFVAGTIFGGGFALRISEKLAPRTQPRKLVNPQPKAGANALPFGTQLLRRFAENLDLSNEQRDKLRPLVLAAESQIAEIRQGSLEQTEKILRKLQEDFRAELQPEQLRKLNRMQQRQQEVMREEQQRRKQQQPFPPQNRSNQNFGPNQPFDPNQRPNRPNQFQGPQDFRPPNPPPPPQPEGPKL